MSLSRQAQVVRKIRIIQLPLLVLRDSIGALLVRHAALILASLQALFSVLLRPVRGLLAIGQAVAQAPQVLGFFTGPRFILRFRERVRVFRQLWSELDQEGNQLLRRAPESVEKTRSLVTILRSHARWLQQHSLFQRVSSQLTSDPFGCAPFPEIHSFWPACDEANSACSIPQVAVNVQLRLEDFLIEASNKRDATASHPPSYFCRMRTLLIYGRLRKRCLFVEFDTRVVRVGRRETRCHI